MSKGILAAIAAVIAYILFKSHVSPAYSSTGQSLTATTSPHGSASGILTPVTGLISGGLSTGVEAFENIFGLTPPGQTAQQEISTMGQATINQSLSESPLPLSTQYATPIAPVENSVTDFTDLSSLIGSGSSDINIAPVGADVTDVLGY